MEAEEALRWLRQVRGQLYRNPQHRSGKRAWVAVVRTPPQARRRTRLIVALGSTMVEAAAAAEGEWARTWKGLGPTH